MEEIVAKAYQIIIRFADGMTMTFGKFIDGSNNICARNFVYESREAIGPSSTGKDAAGF